jgi:hypothetical protein
MTRTQVLVSLAVAIVVGVGLFLGGAPGAQRELRLDEQRVADLARLAKALDNTRRDTGRLPKTLDGLVDGLHLHNLPVDPESGETYGYQLLTKDSYQLCGVFLKPAEAPEPNAFWLHHAGRHCFEFEATQAGRERGNREQLHRVEGGSSRKQAIP